MGLGAEGLFAAGEGRVGRGGPGLRYSGAGGARDEPDLNPTLTRPVPALAHTQVYPHPHILPRPHPPPPPRPTPPPRVIYMVMVVAR